MVNKVIADDDVLQRNCCCYQFLFGFDFLIASDQEVEIFWGFVFWNSMTKQNDAIISALYHFYKLKTEMYTYSEGIWTSKHLLGFFDNPASIFMMLLIVSDKIFLVMH